jgi:hypothetical protein
VSIGVGAWAISMPRARQLAQKASTSASFLAVKAISPPTPWLASGFTPLRRHKPSIRPGAAGSMAKVGEDSIAARPRIEA